MGRKRNKYTNRRAGGGGCIVVRYSTRIRAASGHFYFLFIFPNIDSHPLLEFCSFRVCLPYVRTCIPGMRPCKTGSSRDRSIAHTLQRRVSAKYSFSQPFISYINMYSAPSSYFSSYYYQVIILMVFFMKPNPSLKKYIYIFPVSARSIY